MQQAFSQYEAWNVSYGEDKLTNELFLSDPTNVSTIQRSSQWEVNGSHIQNFKNKKSFLFSLIGAEEPGFDGHPHTMPEHLSLQEHMLTHHTRKHLVY